MASEITELASDTRKLRYAVIEFKKVFGKWYASRVAVVYHMVLHGLRKFVRQLEDVPPGPDVEVRTYTYAAIRGSYISTRDGKSLIYTLSCNRIMEDPSNIPLHHQLGTSLQTIDAVPDVFRDRTFLYDVMRQPVLTSEGQSFELVDLHKFLEGGEFKDPVTKTDLNRSTPYFMNKPLQDALLEWIKLYDEKAKVEEDRRLLEEKNKVMERLLVEHLGEDALDLLLKQATPK